MAASSKTKGGRKEKGSNSGGYRKETLKAEDVLTAVVLADSFNERFKPITLERPRALLPLCNMSLLDYTLEFLSGQDVKRIIVFACAHAHQIKRHVETSKWGDRHSPVKVELIMSRRCFSAGDALREIDARSLIKSHFILLSGDIVSNLTLHPILEAHRERYSKYKASVMTSIFKVATSSHRTRSPDEDLLLAIDPVTKRLLHYGNLAEADRKHTGISLNLFTDHPCVEIRHDLMNCHISICSPEVPVLFTDNFDWATRTDFIKGMLEDDIMGNHVHCHVLSNEYAARVTNLRMYDGISKDVIYRWTFPIVPDNNFFNSSYAYKSGNVYLDDNIMLARSSVVHNDVVMGAGTSVGEGSVITRSVVGRNCRIGSNVTIDGAYLWDGVVVEDNCKVIQSVLCDNVQLLSNVNVHQGCLLSFNVVIGPKHDLAPFTSVTMCDEDDQGFSEEDDDDSGGFDNENADSSDESSEATPLRKLCAWDPAEVGELGHGRIWRRPEDDDDGDNDGPFDLTYLSLVPAFDSLDVNSADNDDNESISSKGDLDDEASDGSDHGCGEGNVCELDPFSVFCTEVAETVRRGVNEFVAIENMVLEINGSKFAYNTSPREASVAVSEGVVDSVLDSAVQLAGEASGQVLFGHISKLLGKMIPLLLHYVKGAECQLEACFAVYESFASQSSESCGAFFKHVLHKLYDAGVLSEEAILKWHSTVAEEGEMGAVEKKLHEQSAALVEWLQEAEEESDDSE